MFEMLFRTATSDEDVINICVGKGRTTKVLVHEPLKGLCCISESKWHFYKLKESKWGGDYSLWYIVRGNGDLVVGQTRSNFEKMVAPCREIEKL